MANQQRQRLIPLKKKKTFFFNFISSKAEEEANNTPRKRTREVLETGNVTTMFDFMPSKAEEEANNTPRIITRELIETGSARIFDPNNIYYIRSTISHCELSNGELLIPFSVMLLNIFPYMDLEIARSFVNENEVHVKLWDDTENNVPKKYGCGRFTVRKLPEDDYHLSIVTLIKDRVLVIGDKIGLCWHPWNSTFVF
uniref:Uncharacterized protein n=1 Tax=Solanum tuberosum TaxID=4113 RepID=M1DJD6_SOLTU